MKRGTKDGGRSVTFPNVERVKPTLLERLADNNSYFARLCKWVAVVSVVGGGAYGAAHLLGKGGMPGFAASALAANTGNETSSNNLKLNKNGLPWPEVPADFPYKPYDKYSWDKEFKNPGSVKGLPDYGSASVVEVNDTINKVWNATKDLKFISKENVNSLWKRIDARVNTVLTKLGYQPSPAHLMVMRNAGIAAFISQNMKYGESDQSIPALGRNEINMVDFCTHPQAIVIANALLSQKELKGVCTNYDTLTMALQAQAGIFSACWSVVDRDRASDTAKNETYGADNHSIVVVYLPTKSSGTIDIWKSEKAFRNQIDGPDFRKYNLFAMNANLVSQDSTKFSRYVGSTSDVLPFPQYFMAGAKGDDFFRIYNAARYAVTNTDYAGKSILRVDGFGDNQLNPEGALPSTFQQFYDKSERWPN
jgi:hypothetical protein